MKGPRVGALLVACFVAAGAAAPAEAAKRKPRCSTAGQTLAASKDMRVYSRGRDELDPVYACAYANGRKVEVATFDECMSTQRFDSGQIEGRYLAVASTTCGLESQGANIDVYDMRRRKRIHRTPEAFTIGAYALSSGGSVAWITGETTREVLKIRTGDTVETLDSGADIDPASLALSSGGTLYWLRGGAVRSAPAG